MWVNNFMHFLLQMLSSVSSKGEASTGAVRSHLKKQEQISKIYISTTGSVAD